MKYLNCMLSLALLLALAGCKAWDDHYTELPAASTDEVETVSLTVAQYIASQPSLKKMAAAYAREQLTEQMTDGHFCTAIVVEDGYVDASGEELMKADRFAANTLSAVTVSPAQLKDGYGVYTASGKNLWVTEEGGDCFFNGHKVIRRVKASNGYVYHIDGVIALQPSLYEYICSLPDDYSLFRDFVKTFEEEYFDADASTPSGTDAMGNIVYSDSVISLRNTLMDRYTSEGVESWNMFSEAYLSTVFIPDNNLLRQAYESALDSIPLFLNRAATAADSLKFLKWTVSSFFVDRKLPAEEVSPAAQGQFECVGGCIREISETTDKEEFTDYDAAWWKPSVQQVDVAAPVELSNGVAYFLTSYKIPNHIIIWRAKSRLYEVWAALDDAQKGWDATAGTPLDGGYFRWDGWIDPGIVQDAQSPFELSSTLPTMYYHVLTAAPSAQAQADSATVRVDYDGLYYSSDKKFGLKEVHLPAGEYYLRMGFKHSLCYSISIYFCGADEEFSDANRLVTDMSLIATGSNFHFDRGGAIEGLDFYGSESIGYREYYDWRWWYEQDPVQYQKAAAYDTDGYQVAIVNLPRSGNFKIRIESNDNAELYNKGVQNRTKNDVYQLMMYHWCLRPTTNNY